MKETTSYTIREYEGIRIVELLGNLTVNTRGAFENLISRVVEKTSLIVNLENVHLISSSGIESLVDLSFQARNGGNRLILLWAPDDFIRATETLDVYGFMVFADSLEQAVAKIRHYT